MYICMRLNYFQTSYRADKRVTTFFYIPGMFLRPLGSLQHSTNVPGSRNKMGIFHISAGTLMKKELLELKTMS